MTKSIGYAMLTFYGNLIFMAQVLDWYKVGADMGILVWPTFAAIAVFLITKPTK